MTRRSKIWRVVAVVAAVIFGLANVFAVWFHAVRVEVLWAGVHAALALLAAYSTWRFAPRRAARRMWGEGEATDPAIGDRLTHLEQSVDAVAIEVERIGEGQRFVTRLFAENGAAPVPGVSGAAAPIGAAATDTPAPAHRS